jgi:hypothetical protein
LLSTAGLPSSRPFSANSTVTEIIRFKVQYLLSEITVGLRNLMALSLANVLSVNVNMVVLSFFEVEMRRRSLLEKGVLVICGLRDFQGTVSLFSLVLTQENINAEMGRLGLKTVQVISSWATAAAGARDVE